ncbi:MAG: hypothetical protein JO245_00745 [Pseudolabrys sp.]|nr:hypothetical protein [Pseudolabrys sp.]
MTVATIATSFSIPAASAAPGKQPAVSQSSAIDLSARRRHYRGGGNAAAMAAFAGIVGTIGALAIEQQRRDAWRERHYYGGYGPYGYGYGYGPRYGYGW